MTNFEEVLYQIEVKKAEDPDFDEEAYLPDFILYTGGNIVSKRLKQFLRKAAQKAQVWRVSKDGDYIDTFMPDFPGKCASAGRCNDLLRAEISR